MAIELTGRQEYLIKKALAIAIGTIDRAADRHQPASDREDMRALLEALAPSDLELETLANSVGWIFQGGGWTSGDNSTSRWARRKP